MMDRLIESRKRVAGEGGFTLIELLVVIVILGILAAVVVFSVAGLNDRGEDSACKIDTRTLRTAQEAHFATRDGVYAANDAALVAAGLLSEESELHDTVGDNAATPPTFTVTVADAQCGTVPSPVDGSANL